MECRIAFKIKIMLINFRIKMHSVLKRKTKEKKGNNE